MLIQHGISSTDENRVYTGNMPAGRPATKQAPEFGQRLAALRKERGWTQPQLAELLGVTVKTVTYYERSASNPTAKTVDRIAEVFGVDPSELIKGLDSRPRKKRTGPPSRLQLIFDRLSSLPRSKQKVVADMLEGYLGMNGKDA